MEAKNDPYCGQKPFNWHTPIEEWVDECAADYLTRKRREDAEFAHQAVITYYPTRAALAAAEEEINKLREGQGRLIAALSIYIKTYGWPEDREANAELRALLSQKANEPK